MKKVILDTNILVAISQFKLDVLRAIDREIEEKYELFVIDKNSKIQKIVDGMPTNSELLEFVKGLK